MPQNIAATAGIIPDLQFEQLIKHTAGDKLPEGDNATEGKTALQEAFFLHYFVVFINGKKANTSGEQHAPMGMSAPENFQKTVAEGADSQHRHRFFMLRHSVTS